MMDSKLKSQLQGNTEHDMRRWCIWQLQKLLPATDYYAIESLVDEVLRIDNNAQMAAHLHQVIGESDKAFAFVQELIGKRQQERKRKAETRRVLPAHNAAVVCSSETHDRRPDDC
jgi:hypothetical protein